MITVFSPKDLTIAEIHGTVTFEEMSLDDLDPIHMAAIADSDVIFYVDGVRIKVLKHFRDGYNGSEVPINMLRPLIMSGIIS
jgi:hypothetical protein